jgi:hypothetical protein
MLKALSHAFYGDQTRWFIGKVVDNADPMRLGRVRVNIVGIHDGVKESGDLPWASVVLPTTEGGLVTGFPPSLDVGAQIFGIFLDGIQSQLPLIIGSIPHILPDFSTAESGADGGVYNSQDFVSGQPGTYQGEQVPVSSASESAETAYNYFRSVGYSDAQSRGIVGNMMVESGSFSPDVVAFERRGDLNTSYPAHGICQWRAERWNGPDGLETWAIRNNMNPKNLMTQLKFTSFELDTFSNNGKAELIKCATPEQAAVTFMRKFERPRVLEGTPSVYRDPPYASSGAYPSQREGEGKRVGFAKNLQFNSRPTAGRGI